MAPENSKTEYLSDGSTSGITKSGSWRQWLIRTLAFFIKEVNEVRRQPKLFISLVGGPFLVLLIFGTTFQNPRPNVQTVLVLPPEGVIGLSIAQAERILGANLNVVDTVADEQQALARLQANEIDLVQIVPPDLQERIIRGDVATLEFMSNTINPDIEAWIQYLAYSEVNEVNKFILRRETGEAQQKAIEISVQIGDARNGIAQIKGEISPEQLADTQQKIRNLQTKLADWEAILPPGGHLLAGQETGIGKLRQNLDQAQADLMLLDATIEAGTVQQHLDDLNMADQNLAQLSDFIDIFVAVSPEQIVSPVLQRYSNIRGQAFNTVIYHAPGLLALLIQHVAVSLGALALVRERLSGTFEVFRVTPVTALQLLLGKYLAYTFFVVTTGLVLVVMMRFIGVPLPDNFLPLFGLILLLTVASLGAGFSLSLISGSDSQAIQLTMLVLLFSVIFSGFFLSLDSFAPAAWIISLLLPMTYGIEGLQYMMLSNLPPDNVIWWGLAIISLVTFGLVWFLTQRAFRQA